MDYAPRASGLTLRAEVHYHRALGSRLDSPGVVRCLPLPLTSAEPGELLAFAARRMPTPQLPTMTPTGRSNRPVPVPGGQPDPTPSAGATSVQQPTACHVERASLPFRSPGQHLHPQLRRPPLAGC